MLFERTLLKRIPQYEAEGILDSTNATRLTEHLKTSVNTEKSYFVSAIYFAGAMLLLASACLLVVNVWDDLSITQRLVVAFVPFVLSGILGCLVLAKGWGFFMRECAGVANIASFVVLIGIIQNTLNIRGYEINISSMMEIVGVAIPIMIIFKSKFSAVVAIIVLSSLLGDYCDYLPNGFFDVAFAVVAFGFIFAFVVRDWRKLGVLQMCVSFVFCICLALMASSFVRMLVLLSVDEFSYRNIYHFDCSMLAVFGVSTLMFLFTTYGKFHNIDYLKLPNFFVGLVMLAFMFFELNDSRSFDNHYLVDAFLKVWNTSIISAVAILIYIVGLLIGWLVMLWHSLKIKEYLAVSVLSLLFPLSILAYFTKGNWYLTMLSSNVIYFVSAGLFAFMGLKKRDYVLTNIGVVMFIFQSVIRVINSEIEILTRAIIFGMSGLVLITVNYILNKRKDAGNEK